jgi:toluene monooxygenase system ferredoxin subunit
MAFHRSDDGFAILIVNVEGTVRAFQGLCPHQRNSLEDADFDGELITCPAHMWEFDARTGAGVNPTTACLAEYPVEDRDGVLYIQTPLTSPRKVGPE